MFREMLASVLKHYPFLSGRPRLANSAVAKRLVPRRDEETWAYVDGMRCRVPLNDWGGRSIFLFGDVDGKLTWIIKRVVEPGETVVDVGGNFGLLTLRLSACVGPTGAVHTFEPNPVVLRYLRQTLAEPNAANVMLVEKALGDEPGELVISVAPGALGKATLARHLKNVSVIKHRVSVVALSDYLEQAKIQNLDFLKIDVEGFEANVLRGLFKSPSAPRPPIMLVEANGPERDLLLSIVVEAGYAVLGIPDRCLLSVPFVAPTDEAFSDCKDILAISAAASAEKLARIGLSPIRRVD